MNQICVMCVFKQISFDNTPHSGRINVDLDNDVDISKCTDWTLIGACELTFTLQTHKKIYLRTLIIEPHCVNTVFFFFLSVAPSNMYMMVVFDLVIILTLSVSLVLCTRSLKAGVLLQFVSFCPV